MRSDQGEQTFGTHYESDGPVPEIHYQFLPATVTERRQMETHNFDRLARKRRQHDEILYDGHTLSN
jgi:hypothetical protein